MSNFHTFKDWWRSFSDDILKEAGAGNWYHAFEKCWQDSQQLETLRCSKLSATRLTLEASVTRAGKNGKLREYLDQITKVDELLKEPE